VFLFCLERVFNLIALCQSFHLEDTQLLSQFINVTLSGMFKYIASVYVMLEQTLKNV